MPALAIDTDRRTTSRHPVDHLVLAARRGGGDARLSIVNISPSGFMANSDTPLMPGERLTLRLPVLGEIEVQHVWSGARRAGFNFERLIRIGDFTRMFMEMQRSRAGEH